MSTIKSVLFVCTGNSCRSTMAEGLLKKSLIKLGKRNIEVYSAGTRAVTGLPPVFETVKVMREENIDVSGFRSKMLTDDMIKKADLILVMEEAHKDEVLRRVPEASGKTHLLKEYANHYDSDSSERTEILDPIGRPMEDYKHCLGLIKKEIDRIAELL